jgi:hypothetical protein
MSELNKDQELARDGRKNVLKDNEAEGLKVTASLRDQIVKKLVSKLKDLEVAEKIVSVWNQGNNDRAEFLARQEEYLIQVDEFLEPIYSAATDWGSTMHLPVILTVVKSFHARMYSALTTVDPMFSMRARKEVHVDCEKMCEQLMRYALRDWANNYYGVNDILDKWIWQWCASGTGLLKWRWDEKFSRFLDVEEVPVQSTKLQFDPQTGKTVEVPEVTLEEREVARTIKTFEGPILENVKLEDLLIVGGEGDPQEADYVIQQFYLTASELLTLVDRKIFDSEAVMKVIEKGEDSVTRDQTGEIKDRRAIQAGETNVTKRFQADRYQVIEAHLRLDVDDSGIASDIIVWLNPDTLEILRATYLRRVMPTGMRPFIKIDFHKRHGTTYGVGLVELLYQLGKEIDAIHNLKMDVGILTSLPFGFYRPTSSTPEEKFSIEPGTMLPLDNPGTDVYFPQLGNKTVFGMQEEQVLMSYVQRLTSVSDLSLGIIGGQGATRTATGTRAILGEANANLDIFLQRMGRGFKVALRYLWHLLQQKVEKGFAFRVVGSDGKPCWYQVQDRKELEGMYDFEIDGNSANSNQQVRLETAQLIYQLTANPIDLQLGLISPLERFEAVKNLLQVNGVKDVSRYLRKPAQIMRVFSPIEIADRILHGFDFAFDPSQDLQGFIDWVDYALKTDEISGQFGHHELGALVAKAQEAQAMLDALSHAQGQQANIAQQSLNTQATQTPGQLQSVGQSPPPPPEEAS